MLTERGRAIAPSVLEEEQTANSCMRSDDPRIAAVVGLPGASPVQVFAELPRRRDRFHARRH